jgi:hypothetical protein
LPPDFSLQPLEPRRLFTATLIDTSNVALYTPTGSPATLAPNRPTWLIIHGLFSSKDDPAMQSLATAIDAVSSDDQVLLLDWSDLAASQPDNATAVRAAWAVADKIAADVRSANLNAKTQLNLIAFSMGAEVEDRLAADLHGVNRLIAIDPAGPAVALDANGRHVSGLVHFKRHARYSIAFHTPAFQRAAATADDSIELTGLSGTLGEIHVQALYVFTTMMRRDAGLEPADGDQVSALCSIPNILSGTLPPWRKNSFHADSEATLACGVAPPEFQPLALTYIDKRGGRQISIP